MPAPSVTSSPSYARSMPGADQSFSFHAPQQPASYKAYLAVPLGRLISAMNRADARASFLSTPPANAFRTGVYEVVSQNWWTSTLGHVEQKESARTLRNRLQRDELAVGRAWLQQCEQSVQPAPCLPVFGETIVCCSFAADQPRFGSPLGLQLGAAVYKAIVDHGRNEADTMRELGEVYGALLQSVAMTNHIVVCRAASPILQTATLTPSAFAGSVCRLRFLQRSFAPVLAREVGD